MAEFHTYRCKGCGHEVQSEPAGHYALMSGQYYNFSCKKCKEIVSLSGHQLSQMGYSVHCPECSSDEIATWNPVEGRCPKCGAQFEEVPGMIIMAD